MAYPRYRLARTHKMARRTSGDLTLNSTAWANVDTGLDIILQASVGDDIEVGINALLDSQAVVMRFDVVTVVSAAPVNSFGKAGAVEASPGVQGILAWYGNISALRPLSGGTTYTIQANDLASGYVTLRLRYSGAAATNRTLYASATNPFQWWAKNIGPADPN